MAISDSTFCSVHLPHAEYISFADEWQNIEAPVENITILDDQLSDPQDDLDEIPSQQFNNPLAKVRKLPEPKWKDLDIIDLFNSSGPEPDDLESMLKTVTSLHHNQIKQNLSVVDIQRIQ